MLMSLPVRHMWPTWRGARRGCEPAWGGKACCGVCQARSASAASAPLGRTPRGCSRPTRTWSTRWAGLSRSGPCPCPRSAPAPSSARPIRPPPQALPALRAAGLRPAGRAAARPHLLLRHAEAVVVLEQVDAPLGQLRGILVLGAQAARVLCAGLRAGVGVEAQLQAWASARAASAGAAGRNAAAACNTPERRAFAVHVVCERGDARREARLVVRDGARHRALAHCPAICAGRPLVTNPAAGDGGRSQPAGCGGLPSMTTYE